MTLGKQVAVWELYEKAASDFSTFQSTTLDQVYILLSKLSSNKANGIDQIKRKIIR